MGTTQHELRIVIPSRGRSTTGTTWALYPGASILVHEREAEAYAAAGLSARLLTHTIEDGHMSEVRNWILDHMPEGAWVIQMDDDIKAVGFFTQRRDGTAIAKEHSPDEHFSELSKRILEAHSLGYSLVGEACTCNPLCFHPTRPLSNSAFIDGHLMAIRNRHDLRFDTRCYDRIDYDISLQADERGLGVLRLNYLWSRHDYRKMKGGFQGIRSETRERAEFEYLMAKWPGRLVREIDRKSGSKFEIRILPRKKAQNS